MTQTNERLTAATAALTHLIWIIVVAPLFLPQVSMCAPPHVNESFDSGSAHSPSSGKNNGVLTLNVIRHAAPQVDT